MTSTPTSRGARASTATPTTAAAINSQATPIRQAGAIGRMLTRLGSARRDSNQSTCSSRRSSYSCSSDSSDGNTPTPTPTASAVTVRQFSMLSCNVDTQSQSSQPHSPFLVYNYQRKRKLLQKDNKASADFMRATYGDDDVNDDNSNSKNATASNRSRSASSVSSSSSSSVTSSELSYLSDANVPGATAPATAILFASNRYYMFKKQQQRRQLEQVLSSPLSVRSSQSSRFLFDTNKKFSRAKDIFSPKLAKSTESPSTKKTTNTSQPHSTATALTVQTQTTPVKATSNLLLVAGSPSPSSLALSTSSSSSIKPKTTHNDMLDSIISLEVRKSGANVGSGGVASGGSSLFIRTTPPSALQPSNGNSADGTRVIEKLKRRRLFHPSVHNLEAALSGDGRLTDDDDHE